MPAHAGGHDSRCDRGDQRVVEVAQERLEPAVARCAVGVDESHQRAAHRGQPGVAGTGGADVVGQGDQPGAVVVGHLAGGVGLARGVVHDHAGQSAERAEQSVELGRPVTDGHHDRHVPGPESCRCRPGRHRSARYQPAGQQPGRTRRTDGVPAEPALHQCPGAPGEAEQTQGAATEQRASVVDHPGGLVGPEGEERRQRSQVPRRRRSQR